MTRTWPPSGAGIHRPLSHEGAASDFTDDQPLPQAGVDPRGGAGTDAAQPGEIPHRRQGAAASEFAASDAAASSVVSVHMFMSPAAESDVLNTMIGANADAILPGTINGTMVDMSMQAMLLMFALGLPWRGGVTAEAG